MKNFVFLICGLLLLSGQITAQEIKKEFTPDEQIIVNKKYDENGNVIQYDSTYIHQWSSDSTFRFSFHDGDFFAGNGFPDLDEFFRDFMNDSAFRGLSFPNNFDPFESDDFFRQFQFPDSMMINDFPFQNDSASLFLHQQPGFMTPNFEEFRQQLNQYFPNNQFPNFQTPQFNNNDQQEDWEKLIEKHQKEIEELKKQWEQQNEE